MAEDAVEYTYNWADATHQLELAMSGLNDSMMGALSGSKAWTVVSRLVSGSPFWKLQNKLRAFADTFVVYEKVMGKSALRTKELGDAMDGYIRIKKKLPDIDPNQLGVMQSFLAGGGDIADNLGFRNALGQAVSMDKKQALSDIVSSERFQLFEEMYGTDEAIQIAKDQLEAQEIMVDKFKERIQWMKDYGEATLWKKVVMQAGKFFLMVSTIWVFIKTAIFIPMLKFLGIALIALPFVVGAVRIVVWALTAIVGYFKPMYESIMKNLGPGEGIFKNIKDFFINLFKGYWAILDAAATGTFGEFLEAIVRFLGQTVWDIGAIVLSIAKTAIGLVGSVILGIFGPIIDFFNSKGSLRSFLKMPKGATGGVRGGRTLVGENGPELVDLPFGSRVHANANSSRMGGNTIHVHVNGRVGASDTEIRDIAQKVAREVGLQMNRSGTTRGAF
mgnify:CR=1 FL=1